MTGYVCSEYLDGAYSVELQLRSLNSKQLELNINMPEKLLALDLVIRNIFRQALIRGKINLNISITPLAKNSDIDPSEARAIISSYKKIEPDLRISLPDLVKLLSNSNTFKFNPDKLEKKVHLLCKELNKVRKKEGLALKKLIKSYLQNITKFIDKIKGKTILELADMKAKVNKHIKKLIDQFKLDPFRLEQEALFYLLKIDITEELERVTCHIAAMTKLLASRINIGKKIDFYCQELFREFNTISAKSVDRKIPEYVVECKLLIDKIREQGQNIE